MTMRGFAVLAHQGSDLVQDLRHATRNLVRRPAFTAVVVLTVGLCIGANAAVFSVVRSILLRPLDFPEPDHLVRLFNSYPHAGNPRSGNSAPDLYDRQESVESLEGVALFTRTSYALGRTGGAERAPALAVTSAFFSVLRTAPALGPGFTVGADCAGGCREAMLAHGLWESAFGADPGVVGEPLHLAGEPYTIVGVLPEGFRFSSWDAQAFLTLTFSPKQRSDAARHRDWYGMIGRLAPGATLEQAQAEIDALNRSRLAAYPTARREEVTRAGFHTVVRPYLEDLTRDVRAPLLLLWLGVIAVLAIGAANVTGLFVLRVRSRSREIAARLALGAKRSRIVREVAAESGLAALAGGALGLLLTRWSLALVPVLEVYGVPRLYDVSVDWVVVMASIAAAAALGGVAGAAPALATIRRRDLGVLQGGRSGSARGLWAMHRGLVSTQVALAFILVMTAGLLAESLSNVVSVDPGFDPEGVSVATLSLPDDRYPDADTRLDFMGRMVEALASAPGVRSVAVADQLPFSGGTPQTPVTPEGEAPDPAEGAGRPFQAVVSPNYFDVLGIELRAGRGFRAGDDRTSPRVAVVDEALAARLWPHRDPLGQRFWRGRNGDGPKDPAGALTVVGVVEPVRHESLMDPEPAGSFYLPMAQHPLGSFRLAVELGADPAAVWPGVRRRVTSLDPALILSAPAPLEEGVAASLVFQRTPMRLVSAFAALGLFLGALGVYGVLGCAVAARTKEIGIRMAVGGTRWDVASLVGRDCLRVVGLGLVLGLVAVQGTTVGLQRLLYGTGPADPTVLACALAVLATSAVLSCVVPVRRATRVDPASVLNVD